MTPEERIAALEEWKRSTEAWLGGMDRKLDQLIAAANMGKGAWWIVIKIGGLVVLGLGALGWALDHLGIARGT